MNDAIRFHIQKNAESKSRYEPPAPTQPVLVQRASTMQPIYNNSSLLLSLIDLILMVPKESAFDRPKLNTFYKVFLPKYE